MRGGCVLTNELNGWSNQIRQQLCEFVLYRWCFSKRIFGVFSHLLLNSVRAVCTIFPTSLQLFQLHVCSVWCFLLPNPFKMETEDPDSSKHSKREAGKINTWPKKTVYAVAVELPLGKTTIFIKKIDDTHTNTHWIKQTESYSCSALHWHCLFFPLFLLSYLLYVRILLCFVLMPFVYPSVSFW